MTKVIDLLLRLVAVEVLVGAALREMTQGSAVVAFVLGFLWALAGVMVIGTLQPAAVRAVRTRVTVLGCVSSAVAKVANELRTQQRAVILGVTETGAVVAAPAVILDVTGLAALSAGGNFAGLLDMTSATTLGTHYARIALVRRASADAAGMALLSGVTILAALIALNSSADLVGVS